MKIKFTRRPENPVSYEVDLPTGVDNTFIGTIDSDATGSLGGLVSSSLRPVVCKVTSDREVRSNGTTRILIRVRLTGDLVPRSDADQAPALAAPEAHVVFSVPSQIANTLNTAGRNRETATAMINLLRGLLVGLLSEEPSSAGDSYIIQQSRILERGVLGVRPLNADDTLESGLDYV